MKAPNGNAPFLGSTGTDTFDFSNFYYGFGITYDSNGGNDTVRGTIWDDTFVPRSGMEHIDGSGGQDTVDYRGSTAAVQVNLNVEVQSGGWAQGDHLISIENIIGSQFGDTLTAKATGSTINGAGGEDTIFMSLGNDHIDGGAGRDIITGTLGGVDVVTGGSDRDTFHFFVENRDFAVTITDFNPLVFQNSHPTDAQNLADTTHDVLNVSFLKNSGVTTDDQADAALGFVISNHDVIVTVHTPYADGTITLQGVADLLPLNQNGGFSVIDHAVSGLFV